MGGTVKVVHVIRCEGVDSNYAGMSCEGVVMVMVMAWDG